MRKTKIICTLGPATDNDDTLRALILAGMDVARFNFSHGSHEEAKARFERLVRVRTELGVPVASMLDTGGPEIRLRKFKSGKIDMKAGSEFTLCTGDVEGDETHVSVTYPGLCRDVKKGASILLDDGAVELSVESVDLTCGEIHCRVLNDGAMGDRKGVNLPGTRLTMDYISPKDRDDLLFGIEQGFDLIAASFVRSRDDIRDLRELLDSHGGSDIGVIAKIENRDGVENIDDILELADGVMVARGDMGVELPIERIPIIQKALIKKCIAAGKPVITATQMLDSMIKNPRPTRAEATDVANAIYDCTSAIMLSGETAAGKYPVEAVKTMSRIAEAAEDDINYENRFREKYDHANGDITTAISHAGCMSAYDLGASAIIAVTCSGRTARMLSKYRPACPVVACTPDDHACRVMQLYFGVKPIKIPMEKHNDSLFSSALRAAKASGVVKTGDIAVLTAGVPLGRSGSTNLLRIVEV